MPTCGQQSICWAGACTSLHLSLTHPPSCLPAPLISRVLSIFITQSLKQTPRKQLCEVLCQSVFPLQAAAAWRDYLFLGSQAYKVAFLSQCCFKSFKTAFRMGEDNSKWSNWPDLWILGFVTICPSYSSFTLKFTNPILRFFFFPFTWTFKDDIGKVKMGSYKS